MANVKHGNLTGAPQWWKHLRDWKRDFWKGERQAQKADIAEQVEDTAYPEGEIVGPCVCGSWPGGKCLRCPRIAP